MRNVEGLDLDILDLRLVSIGALGRPNVIVLSSLTLEPSKGSALGLVVNMNLFTKFVRKTLLVLL